MIDVDSPRTWSLRLRGHFWSGTGPAASIRGRYKVPIFGSTIQWTDPEARAYWATVVGDTVIVQPFPPAPAPDSYPASDSSGADDHFCTYCGRHAAEGAKFCGGCGRPL